MKYDRSYYEGIFVSFLRSRRLPYTGIDEARRTLLPRHHGANELKSFDYVLYGGERNYIVDLKGRKLGKGAPACWATRDDIRGMLTWETLFGPGFRALLVFMYECDSQPADGSFDGTFVHQRLWYCFRAVCARDFESRMKTRSARWKTVDLAASDFDRFRTPFPPRETA
jgi:hypothetical protein